MGLHNTPAGQFYVQHSLRTGEVLQIVPVKRQEMPGALPSVGALGITETFIERRRVTLAADQARVSTPQDHLQQELARAGGERLLETGKAVLAGAEAAAAASSSSRSGGGSMSSSSSSCAATGQQQQDTLPVCSWPESLDNSRPQQPVSLPSFREIDREIDAARHDAEQQQQQQQQQLGCRLPQFRKHCLPSDRKRPAAASATSPPGRRLRSCSRDARSRGSSKSLERDYDDHVDYDGHSSSSNSSGSSPYTAIPAAARFPPVPSLSSAFTTPAPSRPSSSEASSPPLLSYSSSSSFSSSSPSSPVGLASGPPLPQPLQLPKKNKTVWIIRTLEPRRTLTGGGGSGGSGCGDDETTYAPQRVQTHVETHMM